MTLPIVLPATDEATAFLRRLPPTSRQRGEAYFRDERVSELAANPADANEFFAVVRGNEDYKVTLAYVKKNGWRGKCSCPVEIDCKHVYAAMKALLAEHSAAQVDRLSSGNAAAPPSPRENLAAHLEKAVGRKLTPEEKVYTQRLREIYGVLRARRSLWGWELDHLGLKMPRTTPWPRFLESELTFWNYLALTTAEAGGYIPDFMGPITDTSSIEAEVARWQREREVQHWDEIIQRVAPAAHVVAGSAAPVRFELRARFGKGAASLEWRRPGTDKFEKVKPMQARALRDELSWDRAELSPEAAWLWDAFLPRLDNYGSSEIPYSDRMMMRRLRRFFRLPAFNELLLNAKGDPFERPDEVLRWQLEPAQNEEEDYQLHLARPNGAAVPPLLFVLEGQPTLYVTESAVFTGPPVEQGAFAPDKPTSIPAPALETKAGAALLLRMQVDLPPRLSERVQAIPLELTLTCALTEAYPGSSVEQCTIHAAATAKGSTIETWNGFNWEPAVAGKKNEDGDKQIVVHDRSQLHDPRTILNGLDARWEGYAGSWSMRVTKKFPEQFVAWMKTVPPTVKLDLRGELASLTQQTIAGTLKLDVAEAGIDWFDLRVILDIADTTLTQQEIKLLLNARGGFVRLQDKGWRRLEFQLSPEEDEQLARLGLSPRELTAEPQRLHALQLADTAAKRFLPEPQFDRIQRRASELKARVTPEMPEGIRAELRPYQREGFHFLAYLAENRFGGILADDMGLGKTLQTLIWLQWLRGRDGRKKPAAASLVVCPKSVMDNWRAEAERFAPGVRVKVWSAEELPGLLEKLGEADLHVLNYSQLRMVGESLAPVDWLAVVLDEGQYIKNPSSITAHIARSLRAEHRLVLSGTPIENRLMDLWSLMAFAMPGVLGSRAQFGKLYDAKEDPFARRRLSARVRPFLLRRTKSQVAKDLPERIEEDLLCEIEGEQKTLYRAELKRAQQMLLRVQTQKQLAKERFHLLTSLLRLRQICCDPRLVKGDSKAPSAKVEALMEQLEPLVEEGQKVLVFSQFVQMLELLRAEIEPRGWPIFHLAGDTENRGELVSRFQSTEGAAVFLISLKAGGFGLNLTAASYVVLFDPWWNPAVENQAIDRTHRIGQKQNVIAYRLLIKNSIEEKIRTLQKTKSALADDVLGEEKFAQALTIEDLHFLFSEQ